ncbi:MAG: peptidase sortase [Marmoricola sp.]|nr:peptidase sortase [Marmoricola sp.]
MTTGLGARRRVREKPARQARTAIKPGEVDEVVSIVSSTFTMVAIISLWFLLQVLVLSGFSQARSQDLLYGEFRTQLAAATAPLGPVAAVGAPVAVLTVPRLGLEQVVTEGTASGDLLDGPGHRRDTVLPGQSGVSQVYGRGATYGAPFARLTDLRAGDQVIAQTQQAKTVFIVDGIRRDGDRLPQPPQAGQARITLVTAEGSGALGALRPGHAVYVDATATTGQPAPAGRPTAIPQSELAMASDPSALPMLALALALLSALTVAVIAARQRWSLALVWVIAAPVAIALSWVTTDQVMRLLPNLM